MTVGVGVGVGGLTLRVGSSSTNIPMEQSIDSFGGVDAHNDYYYEYEEMVSKGGVSILLLLLELVREWGASVGLRISVGRWSMIIIIFHPHHHRRLMHQKSHEVNAMTEDGGERSERERRENVVERSCSLWRESGEAKW
jgi:hypothetical protein